MLSYRVGTSFKWDMFSVTRRVSHFVVVVNNEGKSVLPR